MTDHEIDALVEQLPIFTESQLEYRAGGPHYLHSPACQGDCGCSCSEHGKEHAATLRKVRRCGQLFTGHLMENFLMLSANPNVNELHTAFCSVSGQRLPLLPFFERGWLEAHQAGITPEDITAVWQERRKGVKAGERRGASLFLRAFCGSDEAIAWVVEESMALKSLKRAKVVDPAKAAVLAASGRPVQPNMRDASKPAGDIAKQLTAGYEQLRKAAL